MLVCEMKVTVCFRNVRVVVPCGNGDLLVTDLINEAIVRYKKATGKSSESWVIVHNLRSFSGGGILDPDDKLKDVADDKEQLIAVFEEQGLPNIPLTNGDGTSISSVGTSSPDLFPERMSDSKTFQNDVEITSDTIPVGVMHLQVRRGSEPALNRLSPIPAVSPDAMKRWSAAVFGDQNDDLSIGISEEAEFNEEDAMFGCLSRDSGRLSILGSTPETLRWVEAADRNLSKEKMKNTNQESTIKNSSLLPLRGDASNIRRCMVILKNEGTPLGIHVVPDYDETGRDVGLIIQGIEPGGRIDRDGRLQVQDRIVEINNQSLYNVNFQQAQEIFKEALQTHEIKLCLIKTENESNPGPNLPNKSEAKVKAGVCVASRNNNPLLVSNTRKIGKKLQIKLNKGPDGLGFSITTRDNPAGGNSPIYIKNILTKGAAVQDGHLKPGDRLLEVNGIEMTGMSQTEAVAILRNTPQGGIVNLIVSRQETESPKLPREMKMDVAPDELIVPSPWKHRETLVFDIPLNDTGSAGLGVSVKGKTSTGPNGTVDLGIFIKSVITGGAASKDGRLHENDQLVNINGISLLGKSNTHAMETLRQAIQQEGPNPDAITLTIARRVSSTSLSESSTMKHNLRDSSVDNITENCNKNLDLSNAVNVIHSNDSKEIEGLKNNIPEHLIEDKDLGLDIPPRNPVIDRLTGQQSTVSSLRNDSYYYATHVSWSPPLNEMEPSFLRNTSCLTSPTVNLTLDDTLILEDEDHTLVAKESNVLTTDSDEARLNISLSDSTGIPLPLNVTSSTCNTKSKGVSEDPSLVFSRDGFGRQSISEKRHAQLDAKNTDTYQRNKKAREEKGNKKNENVPSEGSNTGGNDLNPLLRTNSADSLLGLTHSNDLTVDSVTEIGSHLMMQKSSSLESLQTKIVDRDNGKEENIDRPVTKGMRMRGCNESFRAAVDRSYDVPGGNITETMETLDEESESGSSGLGRGNSIPSSLSGDCTTDDIPRLNKKNKKKGLFKGLGSVFKFGKNRKLSTDQLPRLTRADLEQQKIEAEKQIARKAVQEEQERIQEQYRKLLHQKIEPQQFIMPSAINNNHIANDQNFSQLQIGSLLKHQDKINQLRAEHQRKHQERRGLYPDEHIKEKNDQLLLSRQRFDSEITHIRSHSYDVNDEDSRKKEDNRLELAKYSHYANYEEIQQHLKQQAAFSQNNLLSSNYYEYESIQSTLKTMKLSDSNANSLPRVSHRKQPIQASSSHPLECSVQTSKKEKTKDYSKREQLLVRSHEPFFLIKKNEQTHNCRHFNSSKV